jgi:DNA-binding ferritin-like protein
LKNINDRTNTMNCGFITEQEKTVWMMKACLAE